MPKNLKCHCDGECATDAALAASFASLMHRIRGSLNSPRIKATSQARSCFIMHSLSIALVRGLRHSHFFSECVAALGSHVQLHLLRVCGGSAAHREIMNLRVRGKGRSQFWELAMAPFTPPAQELGGTWGCNEFLFWVPILVTILGTCFGTLRTHNLYKRL